MSVRSFRFRDEQFDVEARRQGDMLSLKQQDGGEAPSWQIRQVGEAEYAARETTDPRRVHTVYAIRDSKTWWVHLDGHTYRFEAVMTRGGRAAAPGSLSAPIPATVVEVLAGNGDTVAADDLLLVLSAMKMQLEVRAPHAGTVADLSVEAGAAVDGGEQLLTIVAPAEDTPDGNGDAQ